MRACTLTVLAGLLIAAAPQDKPEAKKAPLRPGAELPGTFQPYNLNGKFKGRFHCLVCQHGLNPAVLLFVQGSDLDPPTAALLEKLDAAVKKHEKARLAAFAVLVDDQLPDVVGNDERREETAKKLEEAGTKLERVVLALEGKGNLDKYALDADAGLTAVLYDRLKVVDVKTFPKGKLDDKAAQALVEEAVEKLTKKK